ncbi:MAG: glycoside hydrolase family 28 protein [Bacteroidota bacterium]
MPTNWISLLLLLSVLWACQTSPPAETGFNLETAAARADSAWQYQVPAILERIQPPGFPKRLVRVDRAADDHRLAIQRAIDSCAQQGGGKVEIPGGEWQLRGPLHLRSNVHLHLAKDAHLLFSDEPADYLPAVKVRWEGTVCWNYSPFIYAYRQQNIALTGAANARINGQALEWSKAWRAKQKPDKKRLRRMGNDQVPEDQRVFANGYLDQDGDGQDDGYGDGQAHYLRPTLIELYECENILLENLHLSGSAFWTVHPVFSKNITIRGLTIEGGYLNDDGIDPDSCADVLIEDCMIRTEDDAISIKAGRDQDAWERMGSTGVIVRNCRLDSGVNAFCVGSEMSGGVRDVFVENCTVQGGKHGINFKCNLDRGGQVEQVYFRNLSVDTLAEAFLIFRMDYHGYRGNNYPTQFNDFYLDNIRVKQVQGVPFKIVGVPEQPIERVWLRAVDIVDSQEPALFDWANELLFDRVMVNDTLFAISGN